MWWNVSFLGLLVPLGDVLSQSVVFTRVWIKVPNRVQFHIFLTTEPQIPQGVIITRSLENFTSEDWVAPSTPMQPHY